MYISSKILKDTLIENNNSLSNTVCSPISLLIFLDIISSHDDEFIKEEIKAILNAFNYSKDSFYETVENLQNSDTKLFCSSSLWHKQTLTTKKINFPYLETFNIDFNLHSSLSKINSWIKKRTNGLIKKIDVPIPNSELNSILISTLYFKSFWLNQFKASTYPIDFTLLDGSKINVGSLSKSNENPIYYLEDKKFDAIALPYKNNGIQFEAYLPKEAIDFKKFIFNLDNIDFVNINHRFKKTSSYFINFPKFEITSNINFETILTKNNLGKLFESQNSPFFKERVDFKSTIQQKNTIKVNEKGTEATSATYGVNIGSLSFFDIEFRANRPFLFLIRDTKSNSILFLGIVTEPSSFVRRNKWLDKIKNRR